jgi:F0F1-type ATP synthase epsilon subunit
VSDLSLMVLSPAGKLLEERQVDWVQVQLADGGGIGIWPGHAPLLAETVDAPLVYSRAGEERRLELQRGILQIEVGGVVLLTGGEARPPGEDWKAGIQEERFDRLARVLLAQLRGEPEEEAGEAEG